MYDIYDQWINQNTQTLNNMRMENNGEHGDTVCSITTSQLQGLYFYPELKSSLCSVLCSPCVHEGFLSPPKNMLVGGLATLNYPRCE